MGVVYYCLIREPGGRFAEPAWIAPCRRSRKEQCEHCGTCHADSWVLYMGRAGCDDPIPVMRLVARRIQSCPNLGMCLVVIGQDEVCRPSGRESQSQCSRLILPILMLITLFNTKGLLITPCLSFIVSCLAGSGS